MAKTIRELFELSGKVAIVTGGAMGIGKGIAARLAEARASVIIADINLDAARATATEFKALGYKAKEFKSDTSKVSSADETVQAALETFGDLHILVNNAGIYPFVSGLDLTEEIWDRTLGINLKGVAFFAKAA